jgi:hypothetical protein
MASSRFVEVTDGKIREIKINSVKKTNCVKILKQLFASGSVIIGEYSPRLRLGEYSPIITSPLANNCCCRRQHTILNMKYCVYVCPVSLAELCIAERELDFVDRCTDFQIYDVF